MWRVVTIVVKIVLKWIIILLFDTFSSNWNEDKKSLAKKRNEILCNSVKGVQRNIFSLFFLRFYGDFVRDFKCKCTKCRTRNIKIRALRKIWNEGRGEKCLLNVTLVWRLMWWCATRCADAFMKQEKCFHFLSFAITCLKRSNCFPNISINWSEFLERIWIIKLCVYDFYSILNAVGVNQTATNNFGLPNSSFLKSAANVLTPR